jgi:glutathione synthase/RimK-type ligase-like ATP-grasp enzyme
LVMLDDRKLIFDLQHRLDVDVVLERCINHSRAMHGLRILESTGVRCVNTAHVASICGDNTVCHSRSCAWRSPRNRPWRRSSNSAIRWC